MISTACPWAAFALEALALAGAHLANHGQYTRNVGGANCESVANGAGQRGRIAVGGDIFGEHPAGSWLPSATVSISGARARARPLAEATVSRATGNVRATLLL